MQTPRPRLPDAAPIQLQPRDRQALLQIHLCDGLLSERLLLDYCYSDTHPKNAQKRLRALFDNQYLNRNWQPTQWRLFPQLVYWLDRRGRDSVTEMVGETISRTPKMTRNLLPFTLTHHLQINKMRLKLATDIATTPGITLGPWYTDGFFRSRAWRKRTSFHNAQGKIVEKIVMPDGFFTLIGQGSGLIGRRFGFTLELDRATEVQTSGAPLSRVTIDEKLRKGAALVESAAYSETFQLKTGRCLMVTTGWERAGHMLQLAEDAGVAWAWYFTTHAAATDPKHNLVTAPIWRHAGRAAPVSLPLPQHQPAARPPREAVPPLSGQIILA